MIVHEYFEEIFHQKAPKYGRSLLVLNNYSFLKELWGDYYVIDSNCLCGNSYSDQCFGRSHNPVMSTITMLLILGYSSGFMWRPQTKRANNIGN